MRDAKLAEEQEEEEEEEAEQEHKPFGAADISSTPTLQKVVVENFAPTVCNTHTFSLEVYLEAHARFSGNL